MVERIARTMIHRELSLFLLLLLSHTRIVPALSNPSCLTRKTFWLSSRAPFTFIRSLDHSRKRQRITPSSQTHASPRLASNANADNHDTSFSHAWSSSSSAQDLNEFSRKIAPDRVVSVKRDYRMDITATPEERQALAQRFDVELHALQASLQLRSLRDGSSGSSGSSRGGSVNSRSASSGSSSSSSSSIHVEGSVRASVTQTCVRTNEHFRMDVELPLDCIVRPVVPLNAAAATAASEEAVASLADWTSSSPSNRASNGTTKKKQQSKNRDARPAGLFDMDLLELQRLLQDDQMDEEENVVEDEAIYAIGGSLDVGELVSQLFWLSLDPYPKKPGSTPVQKSITG